jgi:hypothetical protein
MAAGFDAVMTVAVVAANCCLLDRSVHALNLAIAPQMPWLGELVVNVVSGSSALKAVAPEGFSFCPHFSDVGRPPPSGRLTTQTEKAFAKASNAFSTSPLAFASMPTGPR